MGRRRRPALALAFFLGIGLCPAASPAGETVTYSYDARGRLVQVSRSGTVNDGVSAAYSYDKADNRTNVTVTADVPTFIINNVSVTEGGTLAFTVTRTGPTGAAVGVSYATANGTATAGSDYNATSGTLSFAPGETTKPVNVTTIDDTTVESAETVLVNLTSPTGGAVIGDAQGVGTINDNDAPPACQGVSFGVSSNGAVTEGATSVFTVTKTGTATGSCAVNFATANGTAIAGSDYNANSGTLTFTSGQTSQTVNVTTIDDATVESAETFSLGLSGATNGATIGTASATATINDNDVLPCQGVSFGVSSNGAVTEGATSVFTITKTGTATGSCAVNFATANGTAIAGSDYTANSGTLTFTTAQTSQTVSVTTIDDATVESAETFSLNLSGATNGATIGTASATATINDNDSGPCASVSYSVNDVTVIEGDPIVFTVTKAGSTSSSCTVNYATADGTATAPTYYTAISGTLTFTSTQTSKTVTVTTVDRGRLNGTKTMFLNLSSPSGGATLSDSQGKGSIQAGGGGGGGCPTCLTTQPPAEEQSQTPPPPPPEG